MHCLGRSLAGVTSVLADFALSDYDEKHIGRISEPYMIAIDDSAVQKSAYASATAVPWLMQDSEHNGGAAAIASLPFYWYLVNNTPTYRAYEQYVMEAVGLNNAHLHTGDDYRCFGPIRAGDTITVTCELSRLYYKDGRQGRMKFIEDVWRFHNQRNVLVGDLVRKAVTIFASDAKRQARPEIGPEVAKLSDGPVKHLTLPAWDRPEKTIANLFDGIAKTYRHQTGKITWTSMIQWMGAVDDYSKTHYDWDYARDRGFPGGVPITAGPQMGAAMIAPVLAWAGPEAWIEEFRHVQRHPVNPGDVLETYGVSRPTADPDRVEVNAWLVDDRRQVRNSGVFVIRRADAAPSAALSGGGDA
ncbi:MAG: hypothetical protein BroJett024_37940 [Alphaproteobacteria bacterium]|nr:MAG: hypothetical protein BroJett024_37940 [Alphaproteobacteria bacterium]